MKQRRDTRSKAERMPILHYAVRLLSARPYAERKLAEKLQDRGYTEDEIKRAIERLKEKKLLNDASFAEEFIRARCQSHPRGRISLVQDLVSRRIPSALARETTTRMVSDEDETAMALKLVKSKLQQYASLERDARNRRIAGLLGRRGFRPQTIFGLIEKLDDLIQQNGDLI
ncbi:recombination regulator RecX [bacterium]|nr:recombination regulator RecX [bacterium]